MFKTEKIKPSVWALRAVGEMQPIGAQIIRLRGRGCEEWEEIFDKLAHIIDRHAIAGNPRERN